MKDNLKPLIKHLIENNSKEILKKSFLNCHVKGLHSIMLLECPGKTIRLFIAEKDHELYKNDTGLRKPMSLGFHPHHCDLTLHCVKGEFTNIEVQESEIPLENSMPIDKYLYQSQILKEKIGFQLVKKTWVQYYAMMPVAADYQNFYFMKANTLHTVAVQKNKFAAWLVYEGKKDKKYKPYCFSNVDLTKETYENFYQKPDMKTIKGLLKKCGLAA